MSAKRHALPAEIEALAASINAKGMLQNLVVEPECDRTGRKTGYHLVTIGEGRRLAQLLRLKRKQIIASEPVRCILDIEHDAQEISLAENVIRSAMHPADEYEAFAELHNEKGMSADDIAARFGVSPAVVRQRLKLAAVSPALIGLYRAGEMNLEQLMAFTLTDDHARQQEVWAGLGWDRDAETIRGVLTEDHVCTNDRRVKFVGVDAYVAAGGIVIRDLFDDGNGGYLTDAALLDRQVLRKLEEEADAVRAEGWSWVTVATEFAGDGPTGRENPAGRGTEGYQLRTGQGCHSERTRGHPAGAAKTESHHALPCSGAGSGSSSSE
jgi:ParB family transcriptional regulator, chromosome partitioning protein